jgi:hypothetical protein
MGDPRSPVPVSWPSRALRRALQPLGFSEQLFGWPYPSPAPNQRPR